MEKDVVSEISIKYCKSNKFILLLVKICKNNNVKNIRLQIERYLSVSKSVSNKK